MPHRTNPHAELRRRFNRAQQLGLIRDAYWEDATRAWHVTTAADERFTFAGSFTTTSPDRQADEALTQIFAGAYAQQHLHPQAPEYVDEQRPEITPSFIEPEAQR